MPASKVTNQGGNGNPPDGSVQRSSTCPAKCPQRLVSGIQVLCDAGVALLCCIAVSAVREDEDKIIVTKQVRFTPPNKTPTISP
jgi:hypothetical protein